MKKTQEPQSLLRAAIRYTLIVVIVVYLAAACYFLVNGRVDLFLYIPIYAAMYGQLPALLLITVIIVFRSAKRELSWSHFKRELWLLILSIMALISLVGVGGLLGE